MVKVCIKIVSKQCCVDVYMIDIGDGSVMLNLQIGMSHSF